MIYAPVIIPTLDRFDHLIQCLDSLNMNHNADKTDVYISVDFPPSEKYQEGHDKICQYLDNGVFRFHKIHVFKQKENLGVINNGLKKTDNLSFLVDYVSKFYDRWIISEDDNVFSPNFLDFVNLGLEKFKDDMSVLAICGYRYFYNIKYDDNNYIKQNSDFNAWGVGFWKNRYDKIKSIEAGYLKKIVFNPFKAYKILGHSNTRMADLIGLSYKQKFKKADNFYTIFMINENMYQVMPSVSKVRNIGWDNTGLHCNGFSEDVIDSHMNQAIDDSLSFEEFRGTGLEFAKENKYIINKEDYRQVSTWRIIKIYIIRLLFFWK